jgi:hypothetical protein
MGKMRCLAIFLAAFSALWQATLAAPIIPDLASPESPTRTKPFWAVDYLVAAELSSQFVFAVLPEYTP